MSMVGVRPHCFLFFFWVVMVMGIALFHGCEKVVLFQLCDHYTCYMNMSPFFCFSSPHPTAGIWSSKMEG